MPPKQKGVVIEEGKKKSSPLKGALDFITGKGKKKVGEASEPPLKRSRTTRGSPVDPPPPKARGKSLDSLPPEDRPSAFLDKFRDSYLPGRNVLLSNFRGFQIVEPFEMMGWGPILSPGGFYLPQQLCDFFKNLRGTEGYEQYMTIVNDLEVGFSFSDLREFLGVNEEGARDLWVTLGKTGREDEFIHMVSYLTGNTNLASIRLQPKVQARDLLPRPRVLFKIINSTILPRVGDLSVVYQRDIFVLYYLLTGEVKLSFTRLMWETIWEAFAVPQRGSIPYACLLSRFMIHLGVANDDDERVAVSQGTAFLTQSTFQSQLKFEQREDGSYTITDSRHRVSVLPAPDEDEEAEVPTGERAEPEPAFPDEPVVSAPEFTAYGDYGQRLDDLSVQMDNLQLQMTTFQIEQQARYEQQQAQYAEQHRWMHSMAAHFGLAPPGPYMPQPPPPPPPYEPQFYRFPSPPPP